MGAGKSVVGRRLAHRLARPFVDTDAAIEDRAGRPVSAIFADDGEAVFRRMERDAIDAVRGSASVVALGGGAIAQPGAAERLASSGAVVYLRARPETLLGPGRRRLGTSAARVDTARGAAGAGSRTCSRSDGPPTRRRRSSSTPMICRPRTWPTGSRSGFRAAGSRGSRESRARRGGAGSAQRGRGAGRTELSHPSGAGHPRKGRRSHRPPHRGPSRRGGDGAGGGTALRRSPAAVAARRGPARPPHRRPRWGRDQEPAPGAPPLRPASRAGSGSWNGAGGPGGRHGRRPHGIHGRHLPARDSLRAGTHHGAGHGRRQHRREGGCESAPGKEPGGRLPPAATRVDRHRPAEVASQARQGGRPGPR